MNARDNILRLLRRQGWENIPCQFSLCESLKKTYQAETGSKVDYPDYFEFPWRWVSVPQLPPAEPVDWRKFYPGMLKNGVFFDTWGVAHEPGSAAAFHMTRMRHPLEGATSLEQLQTYPYPDFVNATYPKLASEIKTLHQQGYAAFFCIGDLIWEIAWYLRGMPQLMMDIADEDPKAIFLLDKVTELACVRARVYASAGLDILHTGDDVGMQSQLMMSTGMYREWIKPRFAKVIAAARKEKPDILVAYHSCGFVEPLINDFIEVGVSVLNPVQPECMDFAEIHAKYGDRLSFWGTIGTQTTMPFGKPEDVRREVMRNLAIADAKGGLLCTPSHLLEPEVPWDNVMAYVQACRDFKNA